MTAFNQTITNALNLFGPQATNQWGVMVWGVDNWAYSSFDLPVVLDKAIGNSLSLTDVIETLHDIGILMEETLTLDVDMSDEGLSDAAGYMRLFGNVANAENRALTSYTNITDQASAYTSVPRPVTSYTTN